MPSHPESSTPTRRGLSAEPKPPSSHLGYVLLGLLLGIAVHGATLGVAILGGPSIALGIEGLLVVAGVLATALAAAGSRQRHAGLGYLLGTVFLWVGLFLYLSREPWHIQG